MNGSGWVGSLAWTGRPTELNRAVRVVVTELTESGWPDRAG